MEFPTTTSYEVWKISEKDGQQKVLATSYKVNAEAMLEEWQKEADHRFFRESGGPVNPQRTVFVLVEATTTRKEV